VDRRAEAAAISAMASGSQHSTMRAISHRIASSMSAAAPGPFNEDDRSDSGER